MSDTNIAGDQQQPGGRRDRSPNFPAIGLGRAIERAQQLFNRARRYEVRLADAATAWGIKATSSGNLQTAAALIAFGIAEDSGSSEARKIRISDLGWRILEDQRPGVRERGLAEAALKPKLIADYAEHWKTGRPDDNFCISELKIDRGFTDEAAARFLRVFDETIQFANPSPADTMHDSETDGEGRRPRQELKLPDDLPLPAVRVGDYIQWTSGGVDQFQKAQKVVWLSEDGSHLRVHASMTGIPMNEVSLANPPAPPSVSPRESASRTQTASAPDINVLLLGGGRLEITANVDAGGLRTLKALLEKYEQILALLAPPTDQGDVASGGCKG